MNEDKYMGGGVLQPDINTADKCLSSCVNDRSCFAMDFDTLEKECFFHDLDRICEGSSEDLHEKEGMINWQMADCFNDTHAYRGAPQPHLLTESECVAECMVTVDCFSSDFNHGYGECFHHMGDLNACTNVQTFENIRHVNNMFCETDLVAVSGLQALGGYLMPFYKDMLDCVNQCDLDSQCVSCDWVPEEQTCWFHYGPECKATQLNDDIIHFQRKPCDHP